MNPRTLLCLLFGLACSAGATLAMPKAAENEAAPVSQGANVARPKASAKPTKAPPGKSKPTGAAKTHPSPAKAQHGSLPGVAAALCENDPPGHDAVIAADARRALAPIRS